jgi:UDP-N-acetylglucosamine acyltransferase
VTSNAESAVRQGVQIHATAIVDSRAQIGEGTVIGPYCIVGSDVVIGKDNHLASHVVIEGHTKVADNNKFFQFCSIGAIPQDLKYRGEPSTLEIGSKNIIREFVTLQPGTSGGGMRTVIGDNNLFMANSHLGHDGFVGNNNVIANSAALAGHVTIGSFIVIGGLVGVHQFVRLGDHSIIGAGAMVAQDIPPFCIAQGDRARVCGINVIGLERRGISVEEISTLKLVYRRIFLAKGKMQQRLTEALKESGQHVYAKQLCDFVASATRGVARAGRDFSE